MKSEKILSLLKWILIAFFVLLIGVAVAEIIITSHYSSTKGNRILLLLFFIGIASFKNKYTWILAIIVYLYSLYYIIIVASKFSDDVAFDLTAPIHILLYKFTNFHLSRNDFFSVLYYFLSFIVFTTYPVRRWYKISAKKAPKIKSYLK